MKKYKSHTKTINLRYQAQWSYSPSDIQDYFEYIIKNHDKVTDNPPIRIYVSKIENSITFRIKTGYYLELLVAEMI